MLLEGTAYVLTARQWGEGGALVSLLCPVNGLLRGLVKRVKSAEVQPFNTVQYRHARRLEAQLGTLTLELTRSRAALWLGHPLQALALAAAAETLAAALPEGHPYPVLSDVVESLLASNLGWRAYAGFERVLLAEIGYGLHLENPVPCAEDSELAYISPTTLRSVPRAVARGYEHRLHPLPHCWGGPAVNEVADCRAALGLTGSLLVRALHGPSAAERLAARGRLVQAYVQGLQPVPVAA